MSSVDEIRKTAIGDPSQPFPAHQAAVVALVGLDEASNATLADCFQQAGITTACLSYPEAERFRTEKFDGCVLRLDERAAAVLELARNAPANFRMVIYGLAAHPGEAMYFSRYGISVVLDDPIQRGAALRAVRATRSLILHEFRRYVRIPLATPVRVSFAGRTISTMSTEISGGGMSLQAGKLARGVVVELEFAMPESPALRLGATVQWTCDTQAGVRFDDNSSGRMRVKEWVDKYLGI